MASDTPEGIRRSSWAYNAKLTESSNAETSSLSTFGQVIF